MTRRACLAWSLTPLSAWLALAGAVAVASNQATAAEAHAHDPVKPASSHAAAPAVQDHAAPASTPAPSTTVVPAPVASAPVASAAAGSAPPESGKRLATEVQSLLNMGSNLAERGDYGASDIAFRQVLTSGVATDREVMSALLGLAQMHRRKGELTKAAAIYERCLKDYPADDRTPDALLNLGRTLRSLGVYKLAIARFYNVLNSTLKLPGEGFERYQVLAKTAQFEIAETHFQAGEFAEAGKFYTRLRLLDLAPTDRARAHFKAGFSLRLQGDREGAITTLRSYIEQWPQDDNVPEARYLLAVSLQEMKRSQEAFAVTLELLRTAKSQVATNPKRWAYWQRKTGNQLANDFFESGDTMNARAIYAGLVELSEEPAWRLPLTYQLALCYERLGVSDKARASYQLIVDAAGASPPADLLEIVTMAKWRIDHLAWRDRVSHQVTAYFDSPDEPSGPGALSAPPLPIAATP